MEESLPDSNLQESNQINSDSVENPPTNSILAKLRADPPPDALANGWNMHRSKSHRGYVYFFNQFTGKCQWEPPFEETLDPTDSAPKLTTGLTKELDLLITNPKPILKRGLSSQTETNGVSEKSNAAAPSPSSPKAKKRRSTTTNPTSDPKERQSSSSSHTANPSSTPKAPEKVRVLHILKKHSKSRNPASWRNPAITITRDEAVAELEEIRSILAEVAEGNDPKELRATFEELARTESDCSSARKMGDLGYFGRKKMKPNFEKVSFGLRVGELSEIVETSSGVHIILRLG